MCITKGKKITAFDLMTEQDWNGYVDQDNRLSPDDIRTIEVFQGIRKKRSQVGKLANAMLADKSYIQKVLIELRSNKKLYSSKLMNPSMRDTGDTAEFLSGALKGIELAISIIEGDKTETDRLSDADLAEGIVQQETVERIRNGSHSGN